MLYRRPLDVFQFLADVSLLIQEALSGVAVAVTESSSDLSYLINVVELTVL